MNARAESLMGAKRCGTSCRGWKPTLSTSRRRATTRTERSTGP